jgi:PAS domain S-box-containing protein
MSQFLKSLNIGKTGSVFIMERSGQLVATSADQPMTIGLDWLIVAVIPEADFMQQIHQNTYSTVVLCLVALIGAIVFCILTARWITQPILGLNQSAKALARGEWHQIAKVNVERSDELGELAKSFNIMTHQLQVSFDEMKALNEALSQSEKRFQLIAQVTNDAIWDWDLLSDHDWWNARIQTIFGYTQDEIEAHIHWWREQIHPDDRERVISGMAQVLDSNGDKRFWSAEYRFRRADGSYAYVADRGFVIRDEDNKPIRMIGGITDITQRKQAEELLIDYNQTLKQQVSEQTIELAREKEFLQVIIDHIPVMITLFDATGRVQFVNRELEQRLGWSSAEIKEIDLLAICCPDLEQRQQVLEHMLLDTGTWIDVKVYTKNNQCIDTSWTNIRLSNELKIGIGQDVGDRKRAEAASILDERNRMAREIHDTLAQAFTGILVQVGATAQVLTDDLEATQAHLDMIDELARIGLTEARRSVSALRPQLLEEGDLSSALHRLVTQMRAATDTALVYEVRGIPYFLPTEVENNLLRMGQEALTNAIKYAHASEIQVELVYENAQCILRVKDDGQGFEAGSVPSVGGFGLLGMSERAEQIGAQLTIETQLRQGTEIIVVVDRISE